MKKTVLLLPMSSFVPGPRLHGRGSKTDRRSANSQTTQSTIQENTMKTSTHSPRIAATIFAALTCSTATVSFASDSLNGLHVRVKYGDLDVSSASGASTLYKRIRGAAETVCHQWKDGDLYYHNIFYECIQKAMSNAVNEVNEPALFTIANTETRTFKRNLIVTSNSR
jgi:UrcA family protein